MRLAVLVSGRGTNLAALLDAVDAGRCSARAVVVISDRRSAAALEVARARGIATETVRPRDFGDRRAWDAALAEALGRARPELIVSAGFMRILGSSVLSRFGGRVINVHPSLLPAFPGKDGPAQAIAARVTISGCTVHVVDEGVDSGPILAQGAVPVRPDDDAASLHARIQRAEHRLLPAVVAAIADGALVLEPAPRWTGLAPARDAMLLAPEVDGTDR